MNIRYLLVFAIVCGSFVFSLVGREAPDRPPTDLKALVSQLESMHKVNSSPHLIQPMVVVLCRIPTRSEESRTHESPHRGYYIDVYVNEIGREAMMESTIPKYPVGTVIIKEKFPWSEEDDPATSTKDVELYTIMIKRETGYNPACGDWEFGAINGDFSDSEVGKLSSCMRCHRKNPEMDFVFRDDYLQID